MSMPINRVAGSIEMPRVEPTGSTSSSGGLDFGAALKDAIGNAGSAERAADDAGQRFAQGDPSVGIHEVMIQSEKAAISVHYAVSLKNKLIEAYKELLSTPL